MSLEQKLKRSQTIMNKVRDGEWHNQHIYKSIHRYNDINFDSNWEVLYAKYLDENKISWSRPKDRFSYIHEGKNHYYTPDFYLIDTQEYIEIKGYQTSRDISKWKHFPHKLIIIKYNELKEMKILGI